MYYHPLILLTIYCHRQLHAAVEGRVFRRMDQLKALNQGAF